MHHFSYQSGILHAEDVNLKHIAAAVGTPFYCYSTATIARHYHVFKDAFGACDPLICYAMKANGNVSVVRTLAKLGSGVDVVSEGEIRLALAAGVAAEKIVFSGVGKTRSEMAFALDAGIFGFNVESEQELRALGAIAAAKGISAKIALRINPDVDAHTHAKISTGKSGDKFGIDWRDARIMYALAQSLPGISVEGVHVHIGSQITSLQPFERAFSRIAELVETLRGDGHPISFVNLGGGLGIPYRGDAVAPPLPKDYADLVIALARRLDARLLFEPGRLIVGNAGILVSEVIYTKRGGDKQFVIVDAGMNDLIRPTLYDAYHEIWPVDEALKRGEPVLADVVGPVCETGDFIARERQVPPFAPGDLLAIMTAGAYGAVQSCSYNSRRLVPEVLVSGSTYAVVRARQTYQAMLAAEPLAPWLV